MSRNRGKFFLLGSIVGFLLGIFLAPKKGSDLRKDTMNKLQDIKENPKEVINDTIETVKDKIITITDDYDSNIDIVEDEIIISKTFENEGDNK